MTTKWSHLPNAKYIDLVLASLKAYPQQWADAWEKIYPTGITSARDATMNVAWDAAWNVAWDAAWNAAWCAARGAARTAAWCAGVNAILALIAYDDCAYMLESDVGELRILAAFGDPKAILLVPACLAFSMIKELEVV